MARQQPNAPKQAPKPVVAQQIASQSIAAQTAAQIPVNYGQAKAEKQAPVQETDSLPETGESTAVGFSLVGLFMTLLAFLGFVDRRTRRN